MIDFVSTRAPTGPGLALSEALAQGLAPDGGLYVPRAFPRLDPAIFQETTLVGRAVRLLAPFFAGDRLEAELPAILAAAFPFGAPLCEVSGAGRSYRFLELFHGPTAAFKDFGARFLAECLSRNLEEETTILVATSGDTGAAVAGAFHGRPGFRVVILYPDGRVSPRQAHQLGAFGGNVETYRVSGTFDDCQAMVKAAFQAPRPRTGRKLASANSISLGRLLPQMTYYADAVLRAVSSPPLAVPGGRADAALSCAARSSDGAHETSFVIPTGNLGNAFAAWMARALSTDTGRRLPIGTLTLATNANRMLVDYVTTGAAAPAATIATLANAMDVGAPSNLERLRHFASDRAGIAAVSVDDAAIAATIATVFRETGYAICPHTACAVAAAPADFDGVFVATAHPAKFDTIVTPICGPVAVPTGLAELLAREAHAAPLAANAEALLDALRG